MCHTSGVEAKAEGEAFHGRTSHHRGRSGKERVLTAWGGSRRIGRVPKEAVAATVRAIHGDASGLRGGDGGPGQCGAFRLDISRD